MTRSDGVTGEEAISMRPYIVISWFALMANSAHATELTATFRQGQEQGGDTYDGCQDTYVVEDASDASHGDALIVIVDCCQGPDEFAANDGLLRFDGIFGTEAGQIPYGAKIIEATLTLRVDDPGAPSTTVHRMLQLWDEDDTYNDWVGGVQSDGEEAEVCAVDIPGSVSGVLEILVTRVVQAWSDGVDNFGWVFIKHDSSDGWSFHSSEAGELNNRPILEVKYAPPSAPTCVGDLNRDGVVDVIDLLQLLGAWGPCPC